MPILAIESSCDETAVAIYGKSSNCEQAQLLASLVSSQIDLHKNLGGVVPELASRNHTLTIAPLVAEALASAGLEHRTLSLIHI